MPDMFYVNPLLFLNGQPIIRAADFLPGDTLNAMIEQMKQTPTEELTAFIKKHLRYNNFPNAASWCLTINHKDAQQLFWKTHEFANHYEHKYFSIVKTIFNQDFLLRGESVLNFYPQVSDFLSELLEQEILPNSDIEFLKSRQGQDALTQRLNRMIAREITIAEHLRTNKSLVFLEDRARAFEIDMVIRQTQQKEPSDLVQPYEHLFSFFHDLPQVMEKSVLEKNILKVLPTNTIKNLENSEVVSTLSTPPKNVHKI